MSLFHKKTTPAAEQPAAQNPASRFAEMALQITADGITVVDARGVIQIMNQAGVKMTGYNQPSDVVGLNYATVLDVADEKGKRLQDGETELAQAFNNKQAFNGYHYTLTPKNGKKIAISISLFPENGTPQSSCLIIFRDVSQAAQTDSQQMEFIATASHEMRTPVASIEGYLGLALSPQTATIDDRARNYLDEAHKACKHLGDLFRDLLDVTKLEDGQMHVHFTPVEMSQTIESIVANYQNPALAERNIHVSYGNGVASAETQIHRNFYCAVDTNFLQEIIDNLIENAVKYTRDGDEVLVNVNGDNEHVVVTVADHGLGIPSNDIPHIFQKFYRVDNSATRTIGGTGLGLYLVKQRVEALNGEIRVESVPDQGSTFYITLPRLSDAEYERMMIAVKNAENLAAVQNTQPTQSVPVTQPAQSVSTTQPVPVAQPVQASPINQVQNNINNVQGGTQ